MSSLAAIFETNAKEAAATVEHCRRDAKAVRDSLGRITQGIGRIIVGGPEYVEPEIGRQLHNLPGVIQNPADEQVAAANAGITGAFAGVASSGSVCVALGYGRAGGASLLMPLHIVLLLAERIVARPRDVFDSGCLGGEGLRRNLVFITGPSATADMGPLVYGVHGPHRLHIVILE